MTKKKLEMYIDFIPAQLRKNKSWYIEYYRKDPKTGKLTRFKERHNINRIKNLRTRYKHAMRIVNSINEELEDSFRYSNSVEQLNIIEAIEIAAKIKCHNVRKKTRETYESKYGIFTKWLQSKELHIISIRQLNNRLVYAFFDDLRLKRSISNTSYNNYLIVIGGLLDVLKDREYIDRNPVKLIKKLPKKGKNRRAFSEPEAALLLYEIFRTNQFLFLATLLQFHCAIRPGNEMRHLKRSDIDFKNNLICIRNSAAKNHHSEFVTLPDNVKIVMHKMGIEKMPSNFFVFGRRFNPNKDKPMSRDGLSKAHKRIIDRLFKEKKLKSISGLTFYSWKDTGAVDLVRKGINIKDIMNHFRHRDLSTTQRYIESLGVENTAIRILNNQIIDYSKLNFD